MAMKMRSGKKRSKSKEEEEPVEEPEQNDEAPKAASTGKKQKQNKRNLRKEQREVLRSKSLGLIRPSDATQKPKKIVFGDDDDADQGDGSDDNLAIVPKDTADNKEEEDDEDDAVEQVSSKAARDMAMAERQGERETKAAQASKKKKKRKTRPKKEKKEESSDEDEDMEEDFFAELDAQKSAIRKARKSKGDTAIPKHTIFQSSNEDTSPTPIEVNAGMELVVLEEDEEHGDATTALSLALTEAPSQSMLHNSRVITDGSDIISAKQKQKHRKSGRALPEPNWRRSKKTNRVLLNKCRGKGKAAANFVVKANVKAYKF